MSVIENEGLCVCVDTHTHTPKWWSRYPLGRTDADTVPVCVINLALSTVYRFVLKGCLVFRVRDRFRPSGLPLLPLSPSSAYTRQLIVLGFCFPLSLYFCSFHGQYPSVCSRPILPTQVSTPPGCVPTRTSLTSLPPKCVIPPLMNAMEGFPIYIIRMWAPGIDSCLFITVSSCGVKNRIGG